MLGSVSLVIKTLLLATTFVWIRATMPRIRYDHLIYLTWKRFLPIAIGGLIFILAMRILIPWHCAGRTDNSDDVKYG
jgi:NADH-quinone oxidoreductase subunit H